MAALSNGIKPTFFAGDLVGKPLNTFAEVMERSHVEPNVEEYLGVKNAGTHTTPEGP